ncbi:MarR family transcriptional regulator [Candidatus Bathyarchaeota archaeon]|nr:MarR family transcriptional regulator [Candidatus Bathyarchaeota archaeon]
MRDNLPVSEKILQTLHNLCATAPELAKKSEELAELMQMDKSEIEHILDACCGEGYVESFHDADGRRCYYLTGKGIIKVCSLFT